MLITKILKSRAQRQGYAIYVDEAFAFTVSEAVLVKFGLYTGQRIDDKTVELVASAEAFDRAARIAINFISYRPRSTKEIINKLLSKGYSTELAQKVTEHLISLNMLNDVEFARMFVRDKLRGKPMGKSMMRRKLLEKGITPQTIERVLREFISEEDEQEAAKKLVERKLRHSNERFAKLDLLRQRKRLVDYLLSRGFSTEIAMKTVRILIAS